MPTIIESFGDFRLQTDDETGQYILVELDPLTGEPAVPENTVAITDLNGAAATTATISGWSMIQVEADGNGGYTVLWQSSNDDYVTWSLDSTGQQQLFEADGDGVVDDAFAFVGNTDDVEVFFNADLDGDGDSTGADASVVVPVESNGAVDLVTSDGEYTLVLAGPTELAITDLNGVAVTAATIPGWAPVQVEADGNGGYTLLWQSSNDDYVTWSLDSTGQQQLFEADGDGVVDDAFAFVGNTDDVEVFFNADLDGDGDSTGANVVPPVVVPVEANGAVDLVTSDGEYTLVLAGPTELAITDLNGVAVTAATIPGWAPVQVEADGNGGYTLLWQSSNDDYVTWSLDSTGQQQLFEADGDGVVDDAFAFVGNTDDVEVFFNADLDGDGDSTGADASVVVPVESNGAVDLVTSDGEYTLVLAGPTELAITDLNGVAVTAATIPGWAPVQVEADGNGGYTLLWQSSNDDYVTWSLDSTGQQQLFEADGDGVVDDAFAFVGNTDDVEVFFNADLDGDGDSTGANVVPPVVVPVEANGAVDLVTSDGEYTLVLAGPTELAITDLNGVAVTAATIPGWAPVQVEADGNGGYTLLWQSSNDDYVTWSLDSTGQQQLFEADGDGVVDDAFAFVGNTDDVEVFFNADLDGDGDSTGANVVPPVVVPVEANGAVDLVTSDGEYTLVLAGPTELAITDLNGVAVTAATIPGWAPVQVEADGNGGYTLLWQSSNDDYVTWSLDSTGQQQLFEADGDGVVDDAFAFVGNTDDVEVFFNADLDGDGDSTGANVVPPVVVPVEANGAVDLVTSDGEYTLVLAGPTELAITDLNGVAVTAATIPGWAPVQVEADGNGGYTLLWQSSNDDYVTWSLDSTGQQQLFEADGDGVVDDAFAFVGNTDDVEVFFNADLDGDGDSTGANVVPPVVVPVEANGFVDLVTSDGVYTLVLADTTEIAITDLNGVNVTSATIPGWSMVQAEADGNGGYAVLWQSGETYVAWSLDSTGQQQLFEADGDGVVDDAFVFVTETDAVEAFFQADLDGDGDTTGPDIVPIEANGDVALVTKNGAYTLVLADASEVEITDVDGLVPPLDVFGFTMIQAEADGNGGYTVLWQAGSEYITWTLDFTGQQQLVDADGDGVVDEEFNSVGFADGIEFTFRADLDDDEFFTLEQNGEIELAVNIDSGQFVVGQDGSGVFIFDELPDPTVPGDEGDLATLDEASPNVTGIQAEQAADGSYIFLIETDTGYEFTTASDQGLLAAGDPTPIAETDAELLFQLDLDGDGFIFVEDNGAVSARADATTGQFIAVDGGGIETGFTFDVSGDAVTQANTPANVLEIELTVDDDFIVLLDTDGTYETQVIASDGVVDAASEASITEITLFEAETLFSVDLNDDGVFGVVS